MFLGPRYFGALRADWAFYQHVFRALPCYFNGVGLHFGTYDPTPRLIRRVQPQISLACVDPVEFCSARLGWTPDPKQEEMLRSTAKFGVLNCSRQWGKSTVAAAKAVHRLWTRPGALVLCCGPTARQSAELLRAAAGMLRRLGIRLRGDGQNQHSVVLPNGSRMVALPGTEATVRGFSAVSLMLIDEASLVKDSYYEALRPMLMVSKGDLWILSTPRGKRGFFYEEWARGGPDWHRIEGPATENRRIAKEVLEKEREKRSAAYFDQEYLCQFVDDGSAVFQEELLEDAVDAGVEAFEFG